MCQFCEKEIFSDKVRDHCHLTTSYRSAAHSNCNNNVKQSQSIFLSVIIHNFSNYFCHLFFEKIVGKKKDKVKFKNITKKIEESSSVTYGCIKFADS